MADERRRPLLAKGELLKFDGEHYGGSGNKYHPRSPEEAWEHLSEHAEQLLGEMHSLPKVGVGRHLLFELELLPNYLASSQFPTKVVDRTSLYVVGSKLSHGTLRTEKQVKDHAPTKTLLVAGDREAVARLAKAIQTPPQEGLGCWNDLRKLERISLPRPANVVRGIERVSGDEPITWEAVLTRIGRTDEEREAWNDEYFVEFERAVEALGGRVRSKYRRSIGRVTFVPVTLTPSNTDQLARFNLLRALRPMAKLRTGRPHSARRVRSNAMLPTPPLDPRPLSQERIAIFDGGIPEEVTAFKNFVQEIHLTSEPKDPEDVDHGALVTSGVVYGPLKPGEPLPQPRAPVDHYRILPVPKDEEEDDEMMWLLDRITTHAPGYPIVNLCVAPDRCVAEDDDAPHVWTATLDQLSRDHNTTFVVAAGNNGEDDATYGYNRVLTPADMVNGIGVGACDCPDSTRIRVTSYSAKGPGREGLRMQPLGVQFGGDGDRLFWGVGLGGQLTGDSGTSFSAPTVTGSLAELAGALGPHATPSAIRAFPIHFVSRSTRSHRSTEIGFGRFPSKYGEHLECQPTECHLLYQDVLPRAQVVSFPVALPDFDAESEVDYKVTVRWTVAYLSETEPGSSVDYTLDGLDVVYRPNDSLRSVTDQTTNRKLGEIDLRTQQEQLEEWRANGPVKVGAAPISDSRTSYRPEAIQRADGKWETVVSRRIPATWRSQIHLPRIEMSYLRRDAGQLVDSSEGLEISLIVSVTASDGTNIYDQIRIQYQQLVPVDVHVTAQSS